MRPATGLDAYERGTTAGGGSGGGRACLHRLPPGIGARRDGGRATRCPGHHCRCRSGYTETRKNPVLEGEQVLEWAIDQWRADDRPRLGIDDPRRHQNLWAYPLIATVDQPVRPGSTPDCQGVGPAEVARVWQPQPGQRGRDVRPADHLGVGHRLQIDGQRLGDAVANPAGVGIARDVPEGEHDDAGTRQNRVWLAGTILPMYRCRERTAHQRERQQADEAGDSARVTMRPHGGRCEWCVRGRARAVTIDAIQRTLPSTVRPADLGLARTHLIQ